MFHIYINFGPGDFCYYVRILHSFCNKIKLASQRVINDIFVRNG